MPAAWVGQRFLTLSLQGWERASSLPPRVTRVAAEGHPKPSPRSGKSNGNELPEAEGLKVVRGEAARAPPGHCGCVRVYPRMTDWYQKAEVPARERSFSDSVKPLKGCEKGGGGLINLRFLNVLELLEN